MATNDTEFTNESNNDTDTDTEFTWTDRTSFYLMPAYAVDEHTGLVILERFNVIAETIDEAKQYVLDWSGRDDVLGWIEITEHDHDRGIPARRDSGVIRISRDECYEMRGEAGRGESACWICGPFDVTRIDHDASGSPCPDCGMTTAMARLLDKDANRKKWTMNLNSDSVGNGTAEEIIADLTHDTDR